MNVNGVPVNMSVADYCNAYLRGEILVDRRYQRSGRVWPKRAQSHLVETILRGFPIPKMALHQITDLKSLKTVKYVVDGQQRTNAIMGFFRNDLRLSPSLETLELQGKTFAELDDEQKSEFLAYRLQFDQFEVAEDDVVREYFRRINAFTSPLTPEERRNANFQGPMKWFILGLTERYSDSVVSLGALTEQRVVRMADQKFLAELVHAMLNGVQTTDARLLDRMYKRYDDDPVMEEVKIRDAIGRAIGHILGWKELMNTGLVTRAHMLYSMLLAIVAVDSGWGNLVSEGILQEPCEMVPDAHQNLLELEDMLSRGVVDKEFAPFERACREQTNTRRHRQVRIDRFAKALTSAVVDG